MTSVANEVRQCIRRDPHLRSTLARGVISHAKLARWLQETKGIAGTEHAVISALRRLDVTTLTDPDEQARETLRHLELDIKSKLVVLTLERSPRAWTRVNNLQHEVEFGLSSFPGDDEINVIVPGDFQEAALEALGRDIFKGREAGLSGFVLGPYDEDKELNLEGVPGLLHAHLSDAGITPEESFISTSEILILVDKSDEKAARRALVPLMKLDEE